MFEADQRGRTPGETLDEWTARNDPPVPAYSAELVEGVARHCARIDEVLTSYAGDWPLERMPAVDRAVLRLATYELLWSTDVPPAVAIDEAVELAKSLSTDESPSFVNGVLARVLADRASLTEPAAPQT